MTPPDLSILLAALESSMTPALVVTDLEGGIVHVNPAFTRMYGYAAEDVIGRSPDMLGAGPGHAETSAEIFDSLRRHGAWAGELRQRRKDGGLFFALCHVNALRDPEGRPLGFSSINMAVGDPHDDSRSSEFTWQATRLLLEQSNDIVMQLDRNGVIGHINRVASPHSKAAVIGSRCTDYLSEVDIPRCLAALARVFTLGEQETLEIEGPERSRWLARLLPCVRENRVAYCLAIATDITPQKRLERELQSRLDERELMFDRLLELSEDAIITVDESQTVIAFNRGASRIFQYAPEEIIGRHLHRLIPERFHAAHDAAFGRFAGEPDGSRQMGRRNGLFGRRKGGEEFPAAASITKTRSGGRLLLTAILRDISEEMAFHDQLQRQQRIESLGTMASGIAHDINNILQSLQGSLALLQQSRPALPPKQDKLLQQSLRGCERLAALTKKLRGLSKQSTWQPAPTDLRAVADEVFSLMGRTVKKTIRFHRRLAPNEFWVLGDRDDMVQVFLNLGLNAAHAIELRGGPDGGNIVIAAERDGGWIHAAIADDDCGMTDEVKQRAFDPFFSTKERGSVKGQGLGLAMAYYIVTVKHGGRIDIESRPGMSTTVHVWLPAATPPCDESPAASADAPAGSGTILVIDDEPDVLEFLTEALAGAGYRVLTALEGRHGLDLHAAHAGAIDLIILDLNMPGMHGMDILAALRGRDPELPVLLASGHEERTLDDASALFLKKPFSPDQLLQAVRNLLDEE